MGRSNKLQLPGKVVFGFPLETYPSKEFLGKDDFHKKAAAGGVPIILTKNGRLWVGELRQQKALQGRLLSILGPGYDEALPS